MISYRQNYSAPPPPVKRPEIPKLVAVPRVIKRRQWRRFTPEEDARLKALWESGLKDLRQLGRLLKREHSSIRRRAIMIGLYR